MKKITFLLALLISTISIWAFGTTNTNEDALATLTVETAIEAASPAAMLSWVETTLDFGKIEQGTPVTKKFSFTNTGSEPLIIDLVKGSCGCTVPEWTKVPVLPGEQGWVSAKFNAKKEGVFNKTLTITTAAQGEKSLRITGEVLVSATEK